MTPAEKAAREYAIKVAEVSKIASAADAFLAGWRAATERAAKVAEDVVPKEFPKTRALSYRDHGFIEAAERISAAIRRDE